MNSWNDNFNNNIMPNLGLPPMPPLLPPMCMMGENANQHPPVGLIGPVQPEQHPPTPETAAADSQNVVSSTQNQRRRSRSRGRDNVRRDNRAGGGGDRPSFRSRSRGHTSRDEQRHDNRYNREGNRHQRERRSKWDNNDKEAQGPSVPSGPPGPPGPHVPQGLHGPPHPLPGTSGQGGSNVSMMNMPMQNMMTNMMPGMMPYQYNNMMNPNMMSQPPMDGAMPMMPNMNMMPNMMDQNMMMMNPQMMPMMANQPIFLSNCVLLSPIPGATTPQRRERPKGCKTIVVAGLPGNIPTDILNEIFQRCGNVAGVKSPRNGVFYVRFDKEDTVEQSFFLSGYRFKFHDQNDSEATTLFIDYALNREDQSEYERVQRMREPTPPRVEPFTPAALSSVSEKIKSEDEFANTAPTLAVWLERGECNKKNANMFYSLVQASYNQVRRLFNEKMQLDEELQNMKVALKDKFAHVVLQFEQVAKILTAAKHQRVSDHFSKQQRKNIEMWLRMTEVESIKEEYNANFDEEEETAVGKKGVPVEKYEEMKKENENLLYELEGYKNEAYLAKEEAERKFEKFKAHFIAQQALQNKQQVFPPLPPMPGLAVKPESLMQKPMPPPPTPDDNKVITCGPTVPPSEAKLISILTAFLMVHPLGASLDYLVSYVRSMTPNVTQATVLSTLQKYTDVFCCKTNGVGASIEHRWGFVTFDIIKNEGHQ